MCVRETVIRRELGAEAMMTALAAGSRGSAVVDEATNSTLMRSAGHFRDISRAVATATSAP